VDAAGLAASAGLLGMPAVEAPHHLQRGVVQAAVCDLAPGVWGGLLGRLQLQTTQILESPAPPRKPRARKQATAVAAIGAGTTLPADEEAAPEEQPVAPLLDLDALEEHDMVERMVGVLQGPHAMMQVRACL
jgi:hypothetical protein